VVNAGRVPIYNLNLSEDVPGYMAAPATALDYPWTHFISGHVGRLASREDGGVHQKYIDDIEASARTTTFAIPESVRPDSGPQGTGPPLTRIPQGKRRHHHLTARRGAPPAGARSATRLAVAETRLPPSRVG